jgi:hypothetical protein
MKVPKEKKVNDVKTENPQPVTTGCGSTRNYFKQ